MVTLNHIDTDSLKELAEQLEATGVEFDKEDYDIKFNPMNLVPYTKWLKYTQYASGLVRLKNIQVMKLVEAQKFGEALEVFQDWEFNVLYPEVYGFLKRTSADPDEVGAYALGVEQEWLESVISCAKIRNKLSFNSLKLKGFTRKTVTIGLENPVVFSRGNPLMIILWHMRKGLSRTSLKELAEANYHYRTNIYPLTGGKLYEEYMKLALRLGV